MHQSNEMEYLDYYALLGVERSSTSEEITRAYRRLARQYHPDLHPGDAQADMRFKQINQAYQVLSDPERRMQYDQQSAGSQPAPPAEHAQPSRDEWATAEHEDTFAPEQGTATIEDVQGAVGDISAAFQEIANQAAEELRTALRDFGAELDSISQNFANSAGAAGNRASRRALRPPPRSAPKSPPYGGKPPHDGRPPKP